MKNSVIVSTVSGKLRGSFQQSSEGDDYYAFKGIPYAKPPVGSLRFQDPEPVEPWRDLRDATKHGPVSLQYNEITGVFRGSEDCLYLNVYTRSQCLDSRAPVMVWIHGGIFVAGSGDDDTFGPDYLLRGGVVVVTLNYRLGVLGFLNLDNKEAPGNQAFKDQVMALRWIQANITHFGGDPNNVTIFGGSAGGCSVHYLCVSKLTKGLFHKAICQSGNALNIWAETEEDPKNAVYEFLDLLGCKERETQAMLDFLRTVDSQRLIETQQKMLTPQTWMKATVVFCPSMDVKSAKPFMPVPVSKATEEGIQVPLMLGYNSMEAIFMIIYLRKIDLNDMDRNFEKYACPRIPTVFKDYNLTASDFRKMYFGNEKISEHNLQKYVEFWSDLCVIEGLDRLSALQIHKSAAPTYLYKFSYDKNITLSKKMLNSDIEGVNHGDELTYLFKTRICEDFGLQQLQEGTGADRVMKQMVELWTNFAKTGIPTPVTSELIPSYWQPLASDVVLRYFNIDEELRMEKRLNIIEQRYSFKKNEKRTY